MNIESAAAEIARLVNSSWTADGEDLQEFSERDETKIVAILRKHLAAGEKSLPDAEGWWWEWQKSFECWGCVFVCMHNELRRLFTNGELCRPGRWVRCPNPDEIAPPAPPERQASGEEVDAIKAFIEKWDRPDAELYEATDGEHLGDYFDSFRRVAAQARKYVEGQPAPASAPGGTP